MNSADVVIVGSGAGAAPVALRCAQAGLEVLVLEKGPDLADPRYRADELAGSDHELLPDLKHEARIVQTRGLPQGARMALGWSANCVGGGTVHMGGFLYRFGPQDFQVRSRYGALGEAIDWPLGYEDFEPWYGMAERELGVAGCDRPVPGLAARSSSYPLPPLRAHPFAATLDAYADRTGRRLMVTPRAVNSVPWDGRPACEPCEACAGHGCRIGAKNSVQRSILARALATGRVRLLSHCRVLSLDAGAEQVRALEVVHADGQRQRIRTPLCVLSATAIESARLLLHAQSAAHPQGIGNARGLVGRHLQFHATTLGAARFALERTPALADPQPFLGRTLIDHQEWHGPDGRLHKGGLLRFDLLGRGLLRSAQWAQLHATEPLYGEALAAALRHHLGASRSIAFEGFHDFLPHADTWMTLDPAVCDQYGVPVARIHLALAPQQRATGQFLADRAADFLRGLGADAFAVEALGGTCSYLSQGSCRFGPDPASSVLDLDCRVHGMDNLYVVDGSFMPTSGAAPPTLTILANAFRVAHHLVARLAPRRETAVAA